MTARDAPPGRARPMSAGDVPSEWLPALRRRAAWDEMGHVIAAVYLGLSVTHSSIVPGGHDGTRGAVAGVTTISEARWPEDTGRCGIGTLQQPAEFSRHLERQIVCCLAGPLGKLMSGPSEPSRGDPDDDFDARAALALARRSDRIRELFVTEPVPRPADEARSLLLSAALNSGDMQPTLTTYAHVAWLRLEARELLERHATQLEALADALNVRVEMTGAEIEAVIRAMPCTCHTWPPMTSVTDPPNHHETARSYQ